MVRARPTLPAGHGEVLERPDFAEWADLLAANRTAASAWSFTVGGMNALDFRSAARREAGEVAVAFCERLAIPFDAARASALSAGEDIEIVATGHQPEIYHPGVWVKDFLVQRLAAQSGALGLDVVVDTDGFDTVEIASPCLAPDMRRCRAFLAVGTAENTYAGTPVPSRSELDDWCHAAAENLDTLPAPAVRRHFSDFCEALVAAATDARNLAELTTAARRRFESSAGTDYLELPVSQFGDVFARFVAHIALDARAFATAYNAELAEYRSAHNTRSAAQPFPDLEVGEDRVELPFWVLRDLRRSPLHVEPLSGGGVRVLAADTPVIELPADPESAAAALSALDGVLVAPKAVPLTMFTRMFLSDLFIHGVGGGRYDRVTDGLIRSYWGVEPPAFVVASMTVYLPIGAHIVMPEEVAAAREQLNRLEHNPDAALDEVEFEHPEENARAIALAQEKRALVQAIAAPDADKKALGARIREVNAELASMLAPLAQELTAKLAMLEHQLAASEVLTDRTYPYCFWSPQEIADKAF